MPFAAFVDYWQIRDRCIITRVGRLNFRCQADATVISDNQRTAKMIFCYFPIIRNNDLGFIIDVPFCNGKFAQLVKIGIVKIHFDSFHNERLLLLYIFVLGTSP